MKTNKFAWLDNLEIDLVKSSEKKIKIALTGGIASGKSTVSNMLKNFGAFIIDFDLLARDVVKPNGFAYEKLKKLLGSNYFNIETKELKRKQLADLIYNNIKIKNQVEEIIHPATWFLMKDQLVEIEKKEKYVIVFDIPLLFEVGLNKLFEEIILVYLPYYLQLERLLIRNKDFKKEEAELILKNQINIDDKIKKSSYIIDNSKTLKETEKEVTALWKIINFKI